MGEVARFPGGERVPAPDPSDGRAPRGDSTSSKTGAAPRPRPLPASPAKPKPAAPARPPEEIEDARHLVPEAYSAPVREEEVELLPALKPWIWALVGVLALWVLLSFPLWWDATGELDRLVDQALVFARDGFTQDGAAGSSGEGAP